MATGIPTPNAGLNQWQLADKLRMDEFNADNWKVDGEIGELRREVAGKAGLAELAAKTDRAELDAKADLASKASTEALDALAERVAALEANGAPGGGTGSGGGPLPAQSRISVVRGDGSAKVSIENADSENGWERSSSIRRATRRL